MRFVHAIVILLVIVLRSCIYAHICFVFVGLSRFIVVYVICVCFAHCLFVLDRAIVCVCCVCCACCVFVCLVFLFVLLGVSRGCCVRCFICMGWL